jgi:protein SCO1/2
MADADRPDGTGERALAGSDPTLDEVDPSVLHLSPEEREERELGENMFFQHISAILLANKDGYVERLYTGQEASPVTLVDGVETLRERW